MKRVLLITGLFFTVCISAIAGSTRDTVPNMPVYKVGIFAPLYLDSMFSEGGSKLYKDNIPKFVSPSLDFVEGAMIAYDSFPAGKQHIQVTIYDTRSNAQPVTQLISKHKLDTLDLMIGAVKDQEYRQLADFALLKNIPFVSATYPNDGGVTANPFLILMNSTLKAHCEAIYAYLLQNHGTDRIFICRKKGAQEDKVAGYFKSLNERNGKPMLEIRTLNLDSTVEAGKIKSSLDTIRQSIIIGASLDEAFATSLATSCYNLHEDRYKITLIGMPNWDGFKGLFKKDALDDFPVYFTSPYFNNKWDRYSRMVINGYSKKYMAKPSDLAFKGFECAYLFTQMLIQHPNDFMSQLNDKNLKLYTEYNFKPVHLKDENTVPDYFENKHLYFIRILNGAISKAW